MASKSMIKYLERKSLVEGRRPCPQHRVGVIRSHYRPIVVLPALFAPDDPRNRVFTVVTAERPAYESDACTGATDTRCCGT